MSYIVFIDVKNGYCQNSEKKIAFQVWLKDDQALRSSQ